MTDRLRAAFLHQAEQCERNGSPLYGDVCRRLAGESIVAEIAPDEQWDRPLQLLGGLHYLALRDGIDPWKDPAAAVRDHADFLRGFLVEHRVQTNEVQRSWMLLPCFLEIARRAGVDTLDLVELGASAGLNLVWDRYRYAYEGGMWGPPESPLELAGEERRAVPADLLALQPRVRDRRGVDLAPVNVTDPAQALLLKAFVWADQTARLERLERAIAALRADPPRLERADIVDRVPELLADRRPGALTIVYATAVFAYVERAAEVVAAIEAAGRTAPLAFLSTGQPAPGEHRYWGLWLRLWPGDEEEVLLAHSGFHGQWLEWLA